MQRFMDVSKLCRCFPGVTVEYRGVKLQYDADADLWNVYANVRGLLACVHSGNHEDYAVAAMIKQAEVNNEK